MAAPLARSWSAGHGPSVYQGLASLPYEWHQIDAFYSSPRLQALRQARGYGREPQPPSALQQTLDRLLDEPGTYQTLLFHTQLLGEEDEWHVFEHTMRRVTADANVWCANQRELATWMLTHAEQFPTALNLDQAAWDPAEFS